jgi:hypothetical protein
LRMNKKALSKMMNEFSQELGMTQPKKNRVGRVMLLAAGGIAGYALIRGMLNRMK